MVIFPDTNLFIHFRDPREVTWSDLVQAETIGLAVGRTVQKELQKKRHELRGRSQDRARNYAKRLGDVAQSGEPFILRESGPRIELILVTRSTGWKPPMDLAEGWGDDQLVADALAFRADHPDADIALLSDDAEVIATARLHDLQILRPPQNWELPPETSSEAKKLAKIEQELAEYRHSEPKIECDIIAEKGAKVAELLYSTSWRPRLSHREADGLVHEITERNPRVDAFNRLEDGALADETDWIVASQDEIAAYVENYAVWQRELASHVTRTGALSDDRHQLFRFELALRNVGARPADGVRLALDLTGSFTFHFDSDEKPTETVVSRDQEAESFRGPPAPPPKPRRRIPARPAMGDLSTADTWLNARFSAPSLRELTELGEALKSAQGWRADLFDPNGALARQMAAADKLRAFHLATVEPSPFSLSMPDLAIPSIQSLMAKRDRNEFYFLTSRDERQGAARWEYECEAFQHRADDALFSLVIGARVASADTITGVLKVRLQAANLRIPFERMVPIRIEVDRADPLGFVRKTLPPR